METLGWFYRWSAIRKLRSSLSFKRTQTNVDSLQAYYVSNYFPFTISVGLFAFRNCVFYWYSILVIYVWELLYRCLQQSNFETLLTNTHRTLIFIHKEPIYFGIFQRKHWCHEEFIFGSSIPFCPFLHYSRFYAFLCSFPFIFSSCLSLSPSLLCGYFSIYLSSNSAMLSNAIWPIFPSKLGNLQFYRFLCANIIFIQALFVFSFGFTNDLFVWTRQWYDDFNENGTSEKYQRQNYPIIFLGIEVQIESISSSKSRLWHFSLMKQYRDMWRVEKSSCCRWSYSRFFFALLFRRFNSAKEINTFV